MRSLAKHGRSLSVSSQLGLAWWIAGALGCSSVQAPSTEGTTAQAAIGAPAASGPTAPRVVVPDAFPVAPAVWRFWGTSLGGLAADITKARQASAASNPDKYEEQLRALYLDTLFGKRPDSLRMNMSRFTIGGGSNPDFRVPLAPSAFDQAIRPVSIGGVSYLTLLQSTNRGTCDINNNPAWQSYVLKTCSNNLMQSIVCPDDVGQDPQTQTLYCNINTSKNMLLSGGPLTSNDIQPCYSPSPFIGWGQPGKDFNVLTETAKDDRLGANHERVILAQAVDNIRKSELPPLVETESLVAPYFAMDSGCQSGHDYSFATPPPEGQPKSVYDEINSITGPAHRAAFGDYITRVVGELNKDLAPSLSVSSVEAFNGPFNTQDHFSDSGTTGLNASVTWEIPDMLDMVSTMKGSLRAAGAEAGVTGFDEDNLGGIKGAWPGRNPTRLDGGYGTFFALLSDRDAQVDPKSRAISAMSYISAHITMGTLVREMAALARDADTPIAVTGQGCCDGPNSFGATTATSEPIEWRNWGPLVNPPAEVDAGASPCPKEPQTRYPGHYWFGADKLTYVMREMIKYLGNTGWHYLNYRWGLFDVDTDCTGAPVLQPQPGYYVVREFMRAVPPGSTLVPVGDDDTIAAVAPASLHEQPYLSLIVYNGDLAKNVPAACSSPTGCPSPEFPSEGRPRDIFAGNVTIKDSPAEVSYNFDLRQFDVAPGATATITILQPDSSELLGESNSRTSCPADMTLSLLQESPRVFAPLYYSGCNVHVNAKADGALVGELPTSSVTVDPNMALSVLVPAHSIYFIKIPLTGHGSGRITNPTMIDDATFRLHGDGGWSHLAEGTFQYWKDMTKRWSNDRCPRLDCSKDGCDPDACVVDSGIYPANTVNHTYSESLSKDAAMVVRFGAKGELHRIRIFSVARPLGGRAQVTVDGSPSVVSTYGEYWVGRTLLYDSGLVWGPHTVVVSNLQNDTALTLDGVETSDKGTQVDLTSLAGAADL